jgi:hypothetical protein
MSTTARHGSGLRGEGNAVVMAEFVPAIHASTVHRQVPGNEARDDVERSKKIGQNVCRLVLRYGNEKAPLALGREAVPPVPFIASDAKLNATLRLARLKVAS